MGVAAAEIAAAIKDVVPDAQIDIPAGRNPSGPEHDTYLDITRIREDTGYQPAFGPTQAAVDYIDWLRGGHDL